MKNCVQTPSVILGVFLSALVVVGYVVADKYAPKAAMRYYKSSFKSAETSDGEKFESLLREGTYRMIDDESWGTKPYANKTSLWGMICSRNDTPVGEYGEYALLMHYAFLYAEQKGDSDLIDLIQSKFDKYYRQGTTAIVRTDQIAYGNVALDLFRWTGDEYYLTFAEKINSWTVSIGQAYGQVLYREKSNTQSVDAIGLVCPFLIDYGVTTNNGYSISLAARMSADYIQWGADAVTGIPAQKYTISNHIKCNRANWGRGIGWYLEGVEAVMNVDTTDFPIVAELLYRNNLHERVALLEQTLLADEDGLYQQYYDQGGLPDMSATIPILYYLNKVKASVLKKDELAALISPYFEEDGIVRYCSPSISFPQQKGNCTYTNLRIQGMALYLIALSK